MVELHKIKSGVYQFKNIINNNIYIGSTCNFNIRKNQHISKLKKNKHHSPHFQRAWNKYGEKSFIFEIIALSYEDTLLSLEQKLINELKPEYNVCKIAGKTTGYKHTEETKNKIRNSSLKRKDSPETKASLEKGRKHNLGKSFNKDLKIKLSLAKFGKQIVVNKKDLNLNLIKVYDYPFLAREDDYYLDKIKKSIINNRPYKNHFWEMKF